MPNIDMEQTDAGVILPVHAQPRSRKNGVVGIHAGRLKVAVTQAPEKGKANAAIIEVLAAALNVRRSQISLFGGETSSRKKFLIANVRTADLLPRLTNL